MCVCVCVCMCVCDCVYVTVCVTSQYCYLAALPQVVDKHVKSPLSTSKSTRNVRIAIESNGKYAVKSGGC